MDVIDDGKANRHVAVTSERAAVSLTKLSTTSGRYYQNLSVTLVSIGKAYGSLGSQPSASSISAISLMFKKGFQLVTTIHLFNFCIAVGYA